MNNSPTPPMPETIPAPPKDLRPKTVWQRFRLRWRAFASRVPRPIKILIATVVGVTLILVGIVLSVPMVPGPGSGLIVAGIAVLATEFVWARNLLAKIKVLWHWFKPRFVTPLIAWVRRRCGLDGRK